jgi:hypothetical protein
MIDVEEGTDDCDGASRVLMDKMGLQVGVTPVDRVLGGGVKVVLNELVVVASNSECVCDSGGDRNLNHMAGVLDIELRSHIVQNQ